ncbi:metal-sensitive transcriptional regulator [Enterococcus durans]|uniref:metal-sensitive transcriptional regulator n=1 Tax=Enterococcus durans TaxID=53345 RepID=UPI003BD0EEAD
MSHLIEHYNEELIKRLNKIEGQVVGIKKMVNSNKDYADILIQLNSAQSAIQKISQILLEAQADHSLMHVSEGADLLEEMDHLKRVITQYNKMN